MGFENDIHGPHNVSDNGAYAHYFQVRRDRISAELSLSDAIFNWQKAGKPESWRAHLDWLNQKVNDMINEENRLRDTF